jgi:hypothetical protein
LQKQLGGEEKGWSMNPFIKLRRAMIVALALVLACLAVRFAPNAFGVIPPPDGGYPGFNTAEGQNALFSLTSGLANTAIGWRSLFRIAGGSFNTAVGTGTLLSNTADGNTAFGAAALLFNTTAEQNTAVGAAALLNNTTGVGNTATGYQALNLNVDGGANSAFGNSALSANDSGCCNSAFGNVALPQTHGEHNTGIGYLALNILGSGSDNTAIGAQSGIFVTGSGNVCIGYDVRGTNADNNSTRIRNIGSTPIVGGASVVIDTLGGNGDGRLGVISSSGRYKQDVRSMGNASEILFALKPVTFRAKGETDQSRVRHYGLIAEDVAAVDADLVIYGSEGRPETLRFDSINAMLLNEFLKEHRKNEEQGAKIARLEKQLEIVSAALEKVSTQLGAVSPSLADSK